MRTDFARKKGTPLEVVLLLDNPKIEDEIAQYLKENFGLVTAWGYEHDPNTKLVMQNPENPQSAYFRVRVKAPAHPRGPFLDFKYLRDFYESELFPGQNPMKEVLIDIYTKFRSHIIGVTNQRLQRCKFPYNLPD